MKNKLIFFVIIIALVSGCFYKTNIIYNNYSSFEDFVSSSSAVAYCFDKISFKKEYREWLFVNEHKFLRGMFVNCHCGYAIENVDIKEDSTRVEGSEYKQIFKGWFFPKYTTLEQLEKRWKNKPKPQGFDEFMVNRNARC